MKRRTLKGFIFSWMGLFFFVSIAQTDHIDPILKKDFPELTRRIVTGQPADFVIVIDRSKSMTPFWDAVKKGISSFIEAIPDNDYISLITFGTDSGYLTVPSPVNQSTRRYLLGEVRKKLEQPTDIATDLGKAFEKTLDELSRPGGNKLKFVFFLTDFKHEPPKGSQYYGTRDSNDDVWQRLAQRRKREHQESVLQVFALLLPLGAEVGRDITLGKAIFSEIEQVDVNQYTLLQWFERRKAEIARDKLRALVRNDAQKPPFMVEDIYIKSDIFGSDGKMYVVVEPAKRQIIDTVSFSIQSAKLHKKGAPLEGFEIEPETAQDILLEPSIGFHKVPIASVRFLRKPIIRATKTIDDTNLEIEGIQKLSPSIEIQKLNISADVPFLVTSNQALKVSYGYIPPVLFVGLFCLVIIAISMIFYLYRPEYISGTFVALGHGVCKVQRSQKRRTIIIGRANQGEGIPISGVNWRLVIQAFRSGEQAKQRGSYAKMEGGLGTLIHKEQRQSITSSDWVKIHRGCTIEVGKVRISFN